MHNIWRKLWLNTAFLRPSHTRMFCSWEHLLWNAPPPPPTMIDWIMLLVVGFFCFMFWIQCILIWRTKMSDWDQINLLHVLFMHIVFILSWQILNVNLDMMCYLYWKGALKKKHVYWSEEMMEDFMTHQSFNVIQALFIRARTRFHNVLLIHISEVLVLSKNIYIFF